MKYIVILVGQTAKLFGVSKSTAHMVVLILEAYSKLTDGVETVLDEADLLASADDRYTHKEVFSGLRRRVNG